MKWFGMKDPLLNLLDNLEQGKGLPLGKIALEIIWQAMGYMLLLSIAIIITPMLLPGIILVGLQMLLLPVSTALENSRPLLSGREQGQPSKKYTRKPTHIPWGYGTRR